MFARVVQSFGLFAVIGLLAACALVGPSTSSRRPETDLPAPSGSVSHGIVRSIDRVDAQPASVGSGALIGGAVGAIVGRELGEQALGRTAATMVGAAAGAMIGNEIERQHGSGSRERIRVSVQFDTGGVRSFELSSQGDLRVGDRVRVENNRIQRF